MSRTAFRRVAGSPRGRLPHGWTFAAETVLPRAALYPGARRTGLGGAMSSAAVGSPPETSAEEPAPEPPRPARRPRLPGSTPAQLRAAGLLVVLLLAATCVTGVVTATVRNGVAVDIVDRVEPLNGAAASVYRALADADVAFVRGSLATGPQAEQVRDDYDDAIEAAADGLIRAASLADDEATTRSTAYLNTLVPAYTEAVERARSAEVRGADEDASLGEASELMQNSLLPVAEGLQGRQARLLVHEFEATRAAPVAALIVALVTLVVLLAVQVWVALRFRRVLNAGLLAATLLLGAGAGWWAVADIATEDLLTASRDHGRAVSEALVPAQIVALQARTSEGLDLARGGDGQDAADFDDSAILLARADSRGGALGAAQRLVTNDRARQQLAAAVAAAVEFRQTHDEIRAALTRGELAEAVRLTTAPRPGRTVPPFDTLVEALGNAVADERAAFKLRMGQAQYWRTFLPVGTVGLTVLAVLCTGAGLWRRLDEYANPEREGSR